MNGSDPKLLNINYRSFNGFLNSWKNEIVEPVGAFGEVNVSQMTPRIGWNFQYSINPALYETIITGSGTTETTNSMAYVSTTAAINSSAQIETKRCLRYVNGVGGIARFTAVFTEGKDGSTQYIGLGNGIDGLKFGYNGETFGILRTRDSVLHFTEITDWSEYNNKPWIAELDFTKGNVFQIKYQWLGFGAIRFYIENPNTGSFELIHRIDYANLYEEPSLYNPTMCLSMEVKNTTNDTDMRVYSPSGMAGNEGIITDELLSVTNSASNTKDVTTEEHILSLRNGATFQSKVNRQDIKIEMLSLAAIGNKSVTVRLYRDATLTGADWTDVNNTITPLEEDITTTAFTGGYKVATYVLTANSDKIIDLTNLSIHLGKLETLTITAESSVSNELSASVICRTQF